MRRSCDALSHLLLCADAPSIADAPAIAEMTVASASDALCTLHMRRITQGRPRQFFCWDFKRL
jgi:hypothetical protein